MDPAIYAAAGGVFLAGLLSTLSPCVLPMLPIVVASAQRKNKFGIALLAAGMIVTFACVGLLLSAFGSVFGFSEKEIRILGAAGLVFASLFLLFPQMQKVLEKSLKPVSQYSSKLEQVSAKWTWGAEFFMGVLLGFVWSPCSGPALGAAFALAAGKSFAESFALLSVFGLGAAIPLFAVGLGFASFLKRKKLALSSFTRGAQKALGVALLACGVLVLSGFDKKMEAAFLDVAPAWFISFTTHF